MCSYGIIYDTIVPDINTTNIYSAFSCCFINLSGNSRLYVGHLAKKFNLTEEEQNRLILKLKRYLITEKDW